MQHAELPASSLPARREFHWLKRAPHEQEQRRSQKMRSCLPLKLPLRHRNTKSPLEPVDEDTFLKLNFNLFCLQLSSPCAVGCLDKLKCSSRRWRQSLSNRGAGSERLQSQQEPAQYLNNTIWVGWQGAHKIIGHVYQLFWCL